MEQNNGAKAKSLFIRFDYTINTAAVLSGGVLSLCVGAWLQSMEVWPRWTKIGRYAGRRGHSEPGLYRCSARRRGYYSWGVTKMNRDCMVIMQGGVVTVPSCPLRESRS